MAQITTSAPIFYSNGVSGASQIVGYESNRIRVARYSFTVPAGVTASKISVNFGQIYTGGGSPAISFKINQDPNSYANALGFNADGAVEAYNDGGRFYARVSGGNIEINTAGTYYLWIFPANGGYGYWAWNANTLNLEIAETRVYRLNINQPADSWLRIKRNGSNLWNGDLIYYNDILYITFGASPGYELTATLNGAPISNGYTHTVKGDVSISVAAEAQGLVYIDTGTALEAYQVFIDNGTAFEQYIPYIDNGSDWNMCI